MIARRNRSITPDNKACRLLLKAKRAAGRPQSDIPIAHA
jgi:hypothetical protein